MSRSYRSVFAAIAGLALLGSGEAPKNGRQPKESAAQNNAAKPLANVLLTPTESAQPVEPPEYYQPCREQGSDGKSDLCAQWSAAKAARNAADWAWYQMWLSLAGVIGLVVTLWFNFRALRLAESEADETKSALAIAETNAEAAVRLADLAEQTSSRQLRAYVYVKAVSLEEGFSEEVRAINVVLTISNSGQTPAYIRKIAFLVSWVTDSGNTTIFDTETPVIFRIHKDAPTLLPYEIQGQFDKSELPGHLLIAGCIEYKDAFGKRYKEPFSWRTMPHDFTPFDEIEPPLKLAYFAIDSIVKPTDRSRDDSKGVKNSSEN